MFATPKSVLRGEDELGGEIGSRVEAMSTWFVRAPSHLGGVLPDSTQSQAQGRGASGGIALLVFSALRETQPRTHSGKNLRPHDGGGGDRGSWRGEVLADISGQVGGEG